MAAAADAVVVVVAPPPLEPVPPLSAAAKVVTYLCLASLWVASAAMAAAIVAGRGWGWDDASPVVDALLDASVAAALVALLFAVVLYLLLLPVMRETGLSLSTCVKVQARKDFEELRWKVLLDTTVLGLLACFLFILLFVAGVMVYVGLLPVEGPQRERIADALRDVSALGIMAICCFIIVPSLALKLWRSGRDAAQVQQCDI